MLLSDESTARTSHECPSVDAKSPHSAGFNHLSSTCEIAKTLMNRE
jgi:hypothetical protein